jgi:hypothetical protein
MYSLQEDYPEMITVKNIGQSWEKRPIELLTLDGYEYMKKNNQKYEKSYAQRKKDKEDYGDPNYVQLTQKMRRHHKHKNPLRLIQLHANLAKHHHHHKKHRHHKKHHGHHHKKHTLAQA